DTGVHRISIVGADNKQKIRRFISSDLKNKNGSLYFGAFSHFFPIFHIRHSTGGENRICQMI
ncbi:MAG: hypothetical protein LUC06_04230, partial [Oscillospiraceae bacterium]|nr:hypothetical protein [Oscillospiraceae bacterium]